MSDKKTKAPKKEPQKQSNAQRSCNYRISDAEYKKELELLHKGVDLLGESRRHG